MASRPTLLDRLARALAPYAGVLTVSTCAGPPDCPPDTENLTIRADAAVSGAVTMESGVDGSISADITKGAPIVDGVWRCQAGVTAGGSRARSDDALRPLPGGVSISCARSVGTASRLLGFDLPLDDLRDRPDGAEREVVVSLSMTSSGATSSTCSTSVDAKVRVEARRAEGEAAPPPEHVTQDFVRDLHITVSVDAETKASGSSPSSAACATHLRGDVALDAHLDAASFSESPTDTCL